MKNNAGEKFARRQGVRILIGAGPWFSYDGRDPDGLVDAINLAFESAVKERVEEAERDWSMALKTAVSTQTQMMDETIREAENKIWEEAAKIAEDESVEVASETDESYNLATRHIASALRARRSK